MKIQDIHNEILTSIQNNEELDSNALIYCKTAENGDFTIHSSKFQKNGDIHKFISNYSSENIKKVHLINQNIFFVVDKQKISKKIVYDILNERSSYGQQPKKNKLYVIEYSSPNIAKKFHPGHLRTTILGNFIKNLLRVSGYDTYSINYLGDWGKQFGLIGLGYTKYGNEEEMLKDPIKHLYDIYVKINHEAELNKEIDEEAKRWFMDLENGKTENYLLWEKFRKLSIEKYKDQYKILNCEFDEYSGESKYSKKGKEFVDKYSQSETNNDSFIKNDEKDDSKYIETKFGKLCVIKNDGSTLYSTRDLAAALDRIERLNPDKIIYVVASQQDLYFKQLFECLKMAGIGYKNNEFICEHVNYGMINGMSTRKGTVVFLEDIIDEAKNVMLNKMKDNKDKFEKIENVNKTCEILAVSALIVQDFNAKRIKNYKFNMEQCTEINGFTGPYLQYVHCRLMSIEEKNNDLFSDEETIGFFETYFDQCLLDDKVFEIIYNLVKYPLIIEKCMVNYEPSTLITYLMDLCKMINAIIPDIRVLGVEKQLAITRLLFFKSARIVIGNGIRLLGITPLERM